MCVDLSGVCVCGVDYSASQMGNKRKGNLD